MDDLEAFVGAWGTFGRECADTVAPEATYQAWFAHHLIEHFGLLRVVREVDFGSRCLDEAAQAIFSGPNLMLDVMVLREPLVNLPRRAHLGLATTDEGRLLRSGLGRLDQFQIISELKVGSTQGKGLRYSAIVQDVRKLEALLRAARSRWPSMSLPTAFVCVLDNNAQHPLNRQHLEQRLQRDAPSATTSVLVHTPPRKGVGSTV